MTIARRVIHRLCRQRGIPFAAAIFALAASTTAATAQTAAAKSAGREMLLGVASMLLWVFFLCFCFFGIVALGCDNGTPLRSTLAATTWLQVPPKMRLAACNTLAKRLLGRTRPAGAHISRSLIEQLAAVA